MRAHASSADAGDVEKTARADVGVFAAIRRELERDEARLVLWLPVFVGLGIAAYFAQGSEPSPLPTLAVLIAAAASAVRGRRRPLVVALAALVFAAALGHGAAQWRTARVAAPVLEARWGPAVLSGRVVSVELRPEGRRLILDRLVMPGLDAARTPARVRLRLPDAAVSPRPGERIAARAQLVPPPEPAAPGAYDFARAAWFERLGGVGSIRGEATLVEPGAAPGWRLTLNAARTALVARVLALDPGPAGQITAALLTGEMAHVAPEVMTAMRDSGLAHLLSISGLHISLVAGIVFVAVRGGLALVPPVALRWPIKKIAAGAAFLAISFYALFAAPGVPTTRAWIMGSIVLLAVAADRAPLSIRLVAWAALGVMVTMPEALLGPSFQMSFAAVLALIAAFEWLGPRLTRWRSGGGGALRIASLAAAMLTTTLVASVATAPFAIFHFNRLALLGIAANLVAVPLTSIVVMPAAVLVFVLLPFGLEAPALAVMNFGNQLVMAIAQGAAAWPGASSLWPTMPDWALGVAVAGGLWLCLWTRPWRLAGLPLIALGLAAPWFSAPPDILVSGDGRALALRQADGTLAMRSAGGDDFTRALWARRVGTATTHAQLDREPGAGVTCAAGSCWVARPTALVAVVGSSRELPSACAHATLLVTTLEVWRACPGPLWLIDRDALRAQGAHAIWLGPDGVPAIRSVRGVRGERPWVAAVRQGRT